MNKALQSVLDDINVFLKVSDDYLEISESQAIAIKQHIEHQKEKIKLLMNTLKEVNSEFNSLSQLDCPQTVNPDEKLWNKIIKIIEN